MTSSLSVRSSSQSRASASSKLSFFSPSPAAMFPLIPIFKMPSAIPHSSDILGSPLRDSGHLGLSSRRVVTGTRPSPPSPASARLYEPPPSHRVSGSPTRPSLHAAHMPGAYGSNARSQHLAGLAYSRRSCVVARRSASSETVISRFSARPATFHAQIHSRSSASSHQSHTRSQEHSPVSPPTPALAPLPGAKSSMARA
ncbi:hypothetical protein PR202_ga20661 [Eleusine coracana subsp. coracana]|uniref:Uncharacterized protein n=1 Tax=Eleusine coracana subsp. coracana TaxID=191504 RepID=A0AAV5CX90_ELECO|nr:hypothetical protein PR202_ga20661 [Eleusine coracana subsp. coracana]